SFRIDIQVVRRLVENEQIRFPVNELAKANFCPLSTTQHFHLALDMLRRQSAARQRGTHFILREMREFIPHFFQASAITLRLYLLLEVADFKMLAKLDRTRKRWAFTENAS